MTNAGTKTTKNYSELIKNENTPETNYNLFWATECPYNINPGKKWAARCLEMCCGEKRNVIENSKLETMSVLQVGNWLDSKRMSIHKERFEESSIDGAALLNITSQKLRILGVTKLGHVMRIRRATGNFSLQIIDA